jgi:hypothetical protein
MALRWDNIELLTFRVQGDFRSRQPDSDPHWYVQNLWDFVLTVTGQDRALGRTIAQPLPDPAEDDGHPISELISVSAGWGSSTGWWRWPCRRVVWRVGTGGRPGR